MIEGPKTYLVVGLTQEDAAQLDEADDDGLGEQTCYGEAFECLTEDERNTLAGALFEALWNYDAWDDCLRGELDKVIASGRLGDKEGA